MKIIYLYSEEKWKSHIERAFSGEDVVFGTSLEEVSGTFLEAEVLSVFVNHSVTREHLDKMPNLKLIATRSTGYDHIDMDATREKGVLVATVPSYGEDTVAEFSFALLLSLSRKVYDSYKQVLEHGSFAKEGLRGFDLKDKTLGIIGTGKIGLNAIRIAKGFSMNVVAYDPFPKDEKAEELGFSYHDLSDLLQQSDIISFHAPYNEHTHHMLNSDNIEMVKDGAYLINTARGGLIQTSALVSALKSGKVAGAALDVLEEEGVMGDELTLLEDPHPNADELRTILSNHYLIDHPRVIITPHNAFNTEEAIQRIITTTIDNIRSFLDGHEINIANYHDKN